MHPDVCLGYAGDLGFEPLVAWGAHEWYVHHVYQ